MEKRASTASANVGLYIGLGRTHPAGNPNGINPLVDGFLAHSDHGTDNHVGAIRSNVLDKCKTPTGRTSNRDHLNDAFIHFRCLVTISLCEPKSAEH